MKLERGIQSKLDLKSSFKGQKYTISDNGIELIKRFEGFEPKPYVDSVGVLTIGYGTTKINDKPIPKDMVITEEEAESFLINDVNYYLSIVEKYISPEINLNQNQVDSIGSLIYNIGVSKFIKSTLLKRINEGDFLKAGDEFLRWVKANGVILPGLVKRRKAERDLFLMEV